MSAESNPRNGFENAVFAAGLMVVLALVAALAYRAISGPRGPADLRARVGAADGLLVTVAVQNAGGAVAEAVRVEVCASDGACAEVEVPYVPTGAIRRATVGFRDVPAAPLTARVVSYLEP